MNFATWSIRNPIPSILLFVLLTLAGFWGFSRLPTQDLPDLDLPRITVTLSQPGAAPAQLETEVARKVEDSLATLNGLNHLQTTVTDGVVSIIVEFELEKNLSDALIETKNAVDSIRSDLPPDLLQPTVSAATSVGQPVLTYARARRSECRRVSIPALRAGPRACGAGRNGRQILSRHPALTPADRRCRYPTATSPCRDGRDSTGSGARPSARHIRRCRKRRTRPGTRSGRNRVCTSDRQRLWAASRRSPEHATVRNCRGERWQQPSLRVSCPLPDQTIAS